MKLARFFVKLIFYVFLLSSVLLFGTVIYLNDTLSTKYKIKQGEEIFFDSTLPITAVYNGIDGVKKEKTTEIGEEYEVNLKLLGLIPLRNVSVEVVDEYHVEVLGTPFGMKLYTEGVLVTDINSVETAEGEKKPAELAGIKKGDYIISVNNKNIYTNEDLSEIVEQSMGKEMKLIIKRKDTKLHIKMTAVLSKESSTYKIGVWVRDSSAGIGTLTFYCPSNGVVCGLGHGICDEDTNELLKLNSGEIVNAEIMSVEKGESGSPGQLKGRFGFKTLGVINKNSECGVYSKTDYEFETKNIYEIALKQSVKNGEAKIYCTIDGEAPQFYSCTINVKSSSLHSKTQNLIVTITDDRLLNKTGGIVQGMSGSPLIQNGKLIGAVTHVLIDDPTKGYAIFAENMLETAQSVSESNKLKEAS